MNEKLKGIIAVFLAVFIWGTTFLATKFGLNSLPPVALAFARNFLALLFFLIVLFFSGKNDFTLIFRKKPVQVFFAGFVGGFLFYVFHNLALVFASSSLVSILVNVNPFFVVLLAFLFLNEKLNSKKLVGVMIGFFGMILVFSSAGFDFSAGNLFLGCLLAVLAALSWAVYVILSKNLLNEFSPLSFSFASTFFGAILLLLVSLAFEDFSPVFSLDLFSFGLIFYLGVFASGIAFLLWNYSLSKISASSASSVLFLSPAIAVFLGVIFLKESFGLIELIGAALCFIGIYFVQKN